MSKYSEFFLRGKSSVVQLELLVISHSCFSKIYHIVRNAANGLTVTLENGSTQLFEYYPLKIEKGETGDDLDQVMTITLGDLGEIFPNEFDRVRSMNGFSEKPKVVYRVYRSDDLSAPMYGPIDLQADDFASTADGVGFVAKAPFLNVSKTGEIFDLERFVMLRGFL